MPDAVSLTRRELDVMSVLWRRGRARVAEVRDDLADDLAYPTVQTMLRVLKGKGYVGHTVDGRAFRFHALVDQDEAADSALGSPRGKGLSRLARAARGPAARR